MKADAATYAATIMLQNAFWKGRAPSGETVELCISLRRLVGDVGLSQRGSNLSRPQPEFQTVLPWVLAVDPPQDLRLLYWAKTPSGSAQDLNACRSLMRAVMTM
ncbi:MAG: hypothetical protein IPI09_14825 [Burkholderiales bacterium]|nr:hypothetical protein [Burkholderiales bacterium]MBK7312267.1 hypothetical protein [Burkholderiales bacterium]